MNDVRRSVGSDLVVDLHDPARLLLQLAVDKGYPVQESLQVTRNGAALDVREIIVPGGGRVHVAVADPGRIVVHYTATVTSHTAPSPVEPSDEIVYVRPSRYAESDRIVAVAQAEFAGVIGREDLLAAVSSWVGSRLRYVPGSSGPTDGAVDTLLLRQGVCRDYAHLVIALLRALDVPARLAAVYAPGLNPMDFHAVAEAVVDGVWRAVDATLLAPRASMVRIATGRDAADTSFLSVYGGAADLLETYVTAVTDGWLPIEDVQALVSLS